jgi:hypothetical protein
MRVALCLALCAVPTVAFAGVAHAAKRKVVKTTLTIEQTAADTVAGDLSVNKSKVLGRPAAALCEQPGSAAPERTPILNADGDELNPFFEGPASGKTIEYAWRAPFGTTFAGQTLVAEVEKRKIPKGIFGNKAIVCKPATSNEIIGF